MADRTLSPHRLSMASLAVLLCGPVAAQTGSGAQPLIGGPLATQLEAAPVPSSASVAEGLQRISGAGYTIGAMRILDPLSDAELAEIRDNAPPFQAPPGLVIPELLLRAPFVRAVADRYVENELDPDYFDPTKVGPDGKPLPRHPLPDGMVVDVLATITLPDGRTRGPLGLITDGRSTFYAAQPDLFYGSHYDVGFDNGEMTISRLVALNDYAITIEDLRMQSGSTVTIALPDGGTTTMTATLRPATAQERLIAERTAALAAFSTGAASDPSPPVNITYAPGVPLTVPPQPPSGFIPTPPPRRVN